MAGERSGPIGEEGANISGAAGARRPILHQKTSALKRGLVDRGPAEETGCRPGIVRAGPGEAMCRAQRAPRRTAESRLVGARPQSNGGPRRTFALWSREGEGYPGSAFEGPRSPLARTRLGARRKAALRASV